MNPLNKENIVNQVQLPARFAGRTQKRNLVQGVSAGLGMASPPYVSIQGGGFTLVDANGEKEPIETKHLDCVIFDVNMDVPVQRVYWDPAKPYNPKAGTYEAPSCWSDNGVGASQNAAIPQSQSCMTCKQNEWGSATSKLTGKPVKACHVIKKIAVVPVFGQIGPDGSSYIPNETCDFPFLLRVPVMSHENLRAYSAKFAGQEFDVSDVVTRISFVPGETGMLDFAAAGFTDQPTEDLIQKFLAGKLTDGLVGRGDVPWKGEVRQVTQQEAARPLLHAHTAAAPLAALGATSAPAAPSPAGGVFAAPQQQPAQEAPRRTRRTKAQIEADAAAQHPQGDPALLRAQQAAPPGGQSGIPPFLQRTAPADAPVAQQPTHGITPGAPPPNAELESALANVFGLPTK